MNKPQITFGMIVLNGEPFIRYNLRALYPFAHQIVVIEGACPAAREIATADGHSIDDTIQILRKFKDENDPQHKIDIVIAEDEGHPNGFWPGEKHEMSQAYAKRATGNYLWQIDVDEFYHPNDIERVIQILSEKPSITAISFPIHFFWGGSDYIVDGFSMRYSGDGIFHRVFSWGKGYQYISHRPPTVLNENGQDLRKLEWVDPKKMRQEGIYLFHYDMLLPVQAERKSQYYSRVDWHDLESSKIRNWKSNIFDKLTDPYHIYTVYTNYSWLSRFVGSHPSIIEEMIRDIEQGKFPGLYLRNIDDIECLLKSWTYAWGKAWRILFTEWVDGPCFRAKMLLRNVLLQTSLWDMIQKFRGRQT